MIKAEDILDYCISHLIDVCVVRSWGEIGVFYNPDNKFKRGVYVLTIKEKDGENDKSSNLDRPDCYRLNFGVSRETFTELFGFIPQRPKKGGVVDMDYDFAQRSVLMPHPVYGWMNWVCIINPSVEAFDSYLTKLIKESYELAKQKARKRK